MDGALDKRLNELALRAQHTGRVCATRFLEPSTLAAVNAAASRAGVKVTLWGGYEGAERCVAAFYAGDPPEAAAAVECQIRQPRSPGSAGRDDGPRD